MKTLSLKSILLALVFSSGLGVAAPDPEQGSEVDLARLKNGEILLQIIDSDKPGGAARVSALFHSSVAAVWDIIGYCKYEFIYVRGLKKCEVLTPGLGNMRVHHRVKNSWYAPTLDFTFDASRGPGHVGEAHLVDGDLKVLQAKWYLVPNTDEAYVIVTHEIRIRTKIPSPRWMVRRTLSKDLPDMLACIRGLAKASGNGQRILGDLERCPGDVPEALK